MQGNTLELSNELDCLALKEERMSLVRLKTQLKLPAVLAAAFFLIAPPAWGPAPIAAQSSQPVCSAEIQFTNARPFTGTDKLSLNIFSTVSKPGSCLPAEIRLTAAYYDAEENVVCSGVMESAITQNSNVQSTNIEIRPLNSIEFFRLKTSTNIPPRRLICINPDTDVEISPPDMTRAGSLRIRATILPRNGGLATTEVRVRF